MLFQGNDGGLRRSAICAYLLAHFGGLLPAPAPATAVQVGPTASESLCAWKQAKCT
jgi:hypothetical protein